MAGFSDYLENKTLIHIFGGTAYTAPGTLYVGLYTAAPSETATGAWGTVTHVGVFDASSSGNLMAWAALTASKTVASGDVFRFDAGDLDITLA